MLTDPVVWLTLPVMVMPAPPLPTPAVKPQRTVLFNVIVLAPQLRQLIQLIMVPPVLEQHQRRTFVVKQIPEVPALIDAPAPMLNLIAVVQWEQHHLIQIVTMFSLSIKPVPVREQLPEPDHIVTIH